MQDSRTDSKAREPTRVGSLPPSSPRLRKRRYIIFVVLIVAGPGLGFWFAPELLMVESTFTQAEQIVVLGGGLEHRAPFAARLFAEGRAPRILVTGKGDCTNNLNYLIRGGVPQAAIELECESASTKENAQNSARLLRAQELKKVLLVTSWYHSRRALATFHKQAPAIEFHAVPTDEHLKNGRPTLQGFPFIMREYVKTLGYWIVYGIVPWSV